MEYKTDLGGGRSDRGEPHRFLFLLALLFKTPVETIPEKPVSEEEPSLTSSPPPVTAATPIPEEKPVVEEKQPSLLLLLPVAATTSVPEKKLSPSSLKRSKRHG